MVMTWNNCFSSKRYGLDKTSKDIRSDFERDWDRIIFSSPFRRLQNKTQVFPLPEEIFVHNRLTHSLEVASVGRSLGGLIGEKIATLPDVEKDPGAAVFYTSDLKYVIAAACLAHDLGNPAFGHSGEEAISKYFKKSDRSALPDDIAFKQLFSPAEWKDLITFEGNANALRILTMKQNGRMKGGFRLTYSTLASILKYPCESLASAKGIIHRKKYGYFKIDEEVFLEIAQELHMIRDMETSPEITYKRHPFVFLVEAADDICYSIIDFEDAHRLGILSYEEVRNSFLAIIAADPKVNMDSVIRVADDLRGDANESIAYLRAKSIGTLIYKATEVFWEQREAILSGTFEKSLINAIPELEAALREIAAISRQKIYNARKVVELEIAGFRIMSGLVEDFVTAALTPAGDREKEHQKILELLPRQYVFDETGSPYSKVMHILDFISGMTDVYALKLYRKLRGIEM
ncbi:dGTPase [Niabella drilacis]|uniref:dGTPase n=2 Tax=Niabella drilacis (strain DSM 25811 / CCM 8410 / CCUG 62505 / LMG 26954 / E90) TaxID=1285928 RepID=A0A1G6XXP8_NIADE|nr:dGTPase [Niabella drilacis]